MSFSAFVVLMLPFILFARQLPVVLFEGMPSNPDCPKGPAADLCSTGPLFFNQQPANGAIIDDATFNQAVAEKFILQNTETIGMIAIWGLQQKSSATTIRAGVSFCNAS